MFSIAIGLILHEKREKSERQSEKLRQWRMIIFQWYFPQKQECGGCLWGGTPQTPPILNLSLGIKHEYAITLSKI